MYNFPFGYKPIEPSTWAYLSSLLMLALFFKFNRFWSFRNFDLFLLILLAPGLLMVHYGEARERSDQRERDASRVVVEQVRPPSDSNSHMASTTETDQESNQLESTEPRVLSLNQQLERMGYLWLFVGGLIWLVRLLYDPLISRKPVLEPNLSIGGLVFLGCSLMIFLFANVLTSSPRDLSGPKAAAQLFQRMSSQTGEDLKKYGPGYPLLHLIPAIPTFVDQENLSSAVDETADETLGEAPATAQQRVFLDIARITAILSQIAIVAGLIWIGYQHFGSFQMGVGMATIFLMLPYTAQFGGDTMHMLPGALLVWSIACFRKPWLSGVLIGLAAGVCYYPFFLLPLWISFYWERGRARFTLGAILAIVIVVSTLAFTSTDFQGFVRQLQSIFGFWWPRTTDLNGIWALNWQHWFRLPFLVAFIVLCISYAFWPVIKNLASLISCTAAAMVAVQFWHGDGGGLYLAWYIPLVLLVIFRPNLDDQVATRALDEPRKSPTDSGAGVVTAA